MKPTKTPDRRLADILKWASARGINQCYAFFKGVDVTIAAHEARIRYAMRNSHLPGIVVEEDIPWIESMELTIECVNNRKQVA